MPHEIPRATINPDRKLPVPIDIYPIPSIRIASKLSNVDLIGKNAIREQALRDQDLTAINEAKKYMTEYSQDIAFSLLPTLNLLDEHGYTAFKNSNPQDAAQEGKARMLLKSVRENQNEILPNLSMKTMAIRIYEVVHIDKSDPVISGLLTESQRVQVQNETQKARRYKDIGRLRDIYLQILPRYLVEKVKYLRQQGKSDEQIAKDHPEIAPRMEEILHLARLCPQNQDEVTCDPKTSHEIQQEAKKERQKTDIHERTYGINGVQVVLGHLVNFAKQNHMEQNITGKIQAIHETIEVAVALVAEPCEEELKNGKRVLTDHGKELKTGLETSIRALPPAIYSLVKGLVAVDRSKYDLKELLQKLNDTAENAKSSAAEFKNEFNNPANTDHNSGPGSIFNPVQIFSRIPVINPMTVAMDMANQWMNIWTGGAYINKK